MLKAMLRKSKKNQKGFTLIELLAVIVILAILAAIAIPSVISIIHTQNQKALAQDALNAIHAAKLYVADNNIDSTTTGLDTANELKPYVDKAGGTDNNDYTVEVTFSSGSAVYEITSTSGLPSGLSSPTEAQLIQFSKNGTLPTSNSTSTTSN